MRVVGRISPAGTSVTRPAAGGFASEQHKAPETGDAGRNLVPVSPCSRADQPAASTRPSAAFLAHLIAVAQHVPQTRRLRRADPDRAIAAYAKATAVTPDHTICRST